MGLFIKSLLFFQLLAHANFHQGGGMRPSVKVGSRGGCRLTSPPNEQQRIVDSRLEKMCEAPPDRFHRASPIRVLGKPPGWPEIDLDR